MLRRRTVVSGTKSRFLYDLAGQVVGKRCQFQIFRAITSLRAGGGEGEEAIVVILFFFWSKQRRIRKIDQKYQTSMSNVDIKRQCKTSMSNVNVKC